MSTATKDFRHQLTALVREHDLESLGDLLCRYEDQPKHRQLIHLAIDKASRMRMPVIDTVFELSPLT
jgi:hypothetical protein